MEILRHSISNNSKIKDPIAKTQNVIQNCTRPNMALSWTKNISFLVLNVRANRLRRRGREKRREEKEKKKKEERNKRREVQAKAKVWKLYGIYICLDY